MHRIARRALQRAGSHVRSEPPPAAAARLCVAMVALLQFSLLHFPTFRCSVHRDIISSAVGGASAQQEG